MIKAIIFDFAGVIASEGFILWLKENVRNYKKVEPSILELSYLVDSGKISSLEFSKMLAKYAKINYKDVWKGISSKLIINNRMLLLIKKLRKKYKVALLTNHIDEWISEIIERDNLMNYFDDVVISSREKVIKPDRKIYQISLERLKVNADESVFIDDRERNVKGAEQIGMKGILFTNEKDLIQKLKTLGVNI